MFASALEKAKHYTRPVLRTRRHFDGRVEFPMGALVVVNPDGWFVSAAHIWKGSGLCSEHKVAIAEYEERRRVIECESSGNKKTAHKLARVKADPNWVTHDSFNCLFLKEHRHFATADVMVNELADIAVGRLEGFDSALVSTYPVFAAPGTAIPTGTSLCKLGFPFPALRDIDASFDGDKLAVHFGKLEVPYFPLEGMFTRKATMVDPDGVLDSAEFLETSTPGIPGQSGGPTFDRFGTIWAIQAQTITIDLGLSGKRVRGRQAVEVPQFVSLGLGAHVDGVRKVLDARSISYETAQQPES